MKSHIIHQHTSFFKCILFLLLTGVFISNSSCKKETIKPRAKEISESNDNSNNNQSSPQYYFRFNGIGYIRTPDAGYMDIYFNTNTEWKFEIDISHFEATASISPTSGFGDSHIRLTYGPAKDRYDCSTYLLLKCTYVDKIYSDGSKHYHTDTYTMSRFYHTTPV